MIFYRLHVHVYVYGNNSAQNRNRSWSNTCTWKSFHAYIDENDASVMETGITQRFFLRVCVDEKNNALFKYKLVCLKKK